VGWMTILGLDWKGGRLNHPFDLVDVPKRSGLFKLHSRQESGEWEVFFVGQAKNLYATLLAYFGTVSEGDVEAAGINRCARERLASGESAFSYAELTSERELNGALHSLYEYYKPACNQPEHVPDVTDVACNPF